MISIPDKNVKFTFDDAELTKGSNGINVKIIKEFIKIPGTNQSVCVSIAVPEQLEKLLQFELRTSKKPYNLVF